MKRPKFKFNKDLFKRSVEYNIKTMYRRTLEEADKDQVFQAAAYALKDQIIDCWMQTQQAFDEQDPKVLVYLSMEFLMGRAFGNDAINLQAFKPVEEALNDLGFDINAIEDREPDPALGNGGLGRLAACFLDSLATLSLPAYGCGIRYRYGMFKQEIRDGYQVEVPDNWLENGNPFELRRPEYKQIIKFGGHVEPYHDEETGRTMYKQEGYYAVKAIPYDMPVVGYGNGFVDTLRIWDAEPMELFHLDSFDKGDYQKAVEQDNIARTICEVLYPNDDHLQGKELRLKQQYFFVSASMQASVMKYLQNPKHDIRKFHEKRIFQMNDTHPTLAVPELMRILMDEQKLTWDEAWYVTTHALAYTNHTIMAEALEKWPIDLFQRLLPRIYQIVEEMNRQFEKAIHERYDSDPSVNVADKVRSMAILYDGQVRMANMAIVAGFSVNGVAKLHTEILKKRELKDFYEFFPKKFNNKTNGVTQRRFLLHANPLLADYVSSRIGKEWITDLSKMKELEKYADDKRAQNKVMEIKQKNKERLAAYILEHNGIAVNPDSIFDVQVKRLHEYKRQFMKILHVMALYNELKANPDREFTPQTFIFGAKAAAGYKNAKLTIKLINAVADVVNNDPAVKDKLCVVFIEDYRVSNAEIIFAAADISEQISTASKEASGTSNMKLMLNGAITMGTMDGANVEIVKEVGEENAFIFGLSSDEVMEYEKNGNYDPVQIYNENERIRTVVNQLVDGTYSPDDHERFRPLFDSLLKPMNGGPADRYFILKDFESYADAQIKAQEAYRDRTGWARMSILNMAGVGKFSSDRTIREYAENIWKLKPVEWR
ncbi:MAG: glycogen/starch/alpha-glucan phosphorylase [Lachnospiraceae bacterium]|nr:glycogen/starch/alpha-glucan phosphorylase [Lachnospiraceae bacterium]